MCGIAGFAGFDDNTLLRAMSASLTHRGPDAEGFYTAPGVGLASRRLSVIDLETGNQPIANETRDVWVVFNGEIYNCDALRADLERRGHVFASKTDTECIVHLYEDHGLDFVQHLRGMFGIALWDVSRQRLVLARDRIGEKPLYYAADGDRLLFGSECKAILQSIRRRHVDRQAVCDYLAMGYVAAPRTFYEGISKLPPAHMLVYEAGRSTVSRYWTRTGPAAAPPSYQAAEDELAHRLEETVQLSLKSDVEVGAFLSGGIDSSVTVALMRPYASRVQTFAVGYAGAATGFNELEYARKVARDLGTEHHELILGAGAQIDRLPSILWNYDEPNGEPTSILVNQLSEFAAKRVKVAMSGTGGDEIFAGYPRYRAVSLRERYLRVPRFVRKQMIERVLSAWPESTRGGRMARRARRFVATADLPVDAAYVSWVSLLPADVRHGLLADSVRRDAADPAGDKVLRDYLLGPEAGLLDRATALDVEQYLPEYQLTYVDRMSMAHSLEVRAPLTDYTLVDFVTSLPIGYRLQGDHSKHIFKQVSRRWIDPAIAERKKVGFDSPVGQWFKDELRPFLTSFMAPEQISRSGLLEPAAVQRLIADHLTGRRDYSLQLWSLVTLEAWYRMYVEDGVVSGRDYKLADLRGVPAAMAKGKGATAAAALVPEAPTPVGQS
jgi:asparagine synthase (glutamine-hydrolysing)